MAMQAKRSKATILAGLALLAGLTGCSAESHTGDPTGALRAGEGGTGGRAPIGPGSYAGTRGDVWISDPEVPAEPPPPPPPHTPLPDAGEPPIQESDAATPEQPPPIEQPFCAPIPAEWLSPGNAGDGSTSGCARKVCQGVAPPTGEELDQMILPTPVLGPERYEGCTQIDGDVIINNYQGSDLSELSCLEYMNGTLLVWHSPGLTSLGGLESLRFVSGDMRIGAAGAFHYVNDALTRLDALAQLEGVGGSLVINGAPLTSLEGLGRVRAIGGTLTIATPWGLSDLTGLEGLEQIGGDLDLWRFEGPTSLAGLDALRSIGGNVYIIRSDKLVESPGDLPSVTCIGGTIDLSGFMDWAPNEALVNADFFPALDRIGGDVLVHIQPQLRTFSILQNVSHIRGSLYLLGNPLLTTVPLPRLQHIAGLTARDNSQLDDCPLLEVATAIDASFSFSGNAGDCGSP